MTTYMQEILEHLSYLKLPCKDPCNNFVTIQEVTEYPVWEICFPMEVFEKPVFSLLKRAW